MKRLVIFGLEPLTISNKAFFLRDGQSNEQARHTRKMNPFNSTRWESYVGDVAVKGQASQIGI